MKRDKCLREHINSKREWKLNKEKKIKNFVTTNWKRSVMKALSSEQRAQPKTNPK